MRRYWAPTGPAPPVKDDHQSSRSAYSAVARSEDSVTPTSPVASSSPASWPCRRPNRSDSPTAAGSISDTARQKVVRSGIRSNSQKQRAIRPPGRVTRSHLAGGPGRVAEEAGDEGAKADVELVVGPGQVLGRPGSDVDSGVTLATRRDEGG